jgi:pimeloyl-ACP methyl ester carboxylesterase
MLDQEMMDLMWAGIRSYRMERKFPALLTDDQLATITVPALLVTGARSALITPAQARDRASHLPNAQVAIVPGSHGGFNRLDALNAQVVAFLQSVGAAAA